MARPAITKDNLSPLLEIVIWFYLVVAILTALIRFLTKRYVLHKFELEDLFCFVSLVLYWRLHVVTLWTWAMIEDFCLRAVAFDLSQSPCYSEPTKISVIAQGLSEYFADGLNR